MNNDKKNKWGKIKEDSEAADKDHLIEPAEHHKKTTHHYAKEAHDTEKGADPEGELEHLDYEALEEKLTLAEQKAHETWEKLVRMTAEVDNVRRRAARDVEAAHRYGLEKLITSLLPVLDSLEQAIQLVDRQTHPAMFEGLQLTMKLFLSTLEKQDVCQLDPVGEPFNPQEHEVMSMMESPHLPPNSVLTVFQKGYRLAERIIRPARVIIVKS
ncbi:MAG: nucleotide exchange factor GrpE [Legionellales bacterium RIFCSPHIGHO2_12_FULL_42_9]|nr:MAG: nucleotide exchange factor GrpE [Legionellales bacterium RIFCSPHIGHO2_12_FULL_42_9]